MYSRLITLQEWATDVSPLSPDIAARLIDTILRQGFNGLTTETLHTRFEWNQIAYLSGLTREYTS